MKINDYGLISIETIDNYLDNIQAEKKYLCEVYDFNKLDETVGEHLMTRRTIEGFLRTLKQQLIPATTLAEKAFEAGEYCEKEKLKMSFDNPMSRFINTEIEL